MAFQQLDSGFLGEQGRAGSGDRVVTSTLYLMPFPLLSLSHLLVSAVLNYPVALTCVCITAFPSQKPDIALTLQVMIVIAGRADLVLILL